VSEHRSQAELALHPLIDAFRPCVLPVNRRKLMASKVSKEVDVVAVSSDGGSVTRGVSSEKVRSV